MTAPAPRKVRYCGVECDIDEEGRTIGPNGPITSTLPTWREYLGLPEGEELPPVVGLAPPPRKVSP